MYLIVFFAVVVGTPIALLLVVRRGRTGRLDTDPQGNRDIGRHGGVPLGVQTRIDGGSGGF